MASGLRTKLIRPHAAGCGAVEAVRNGQWSNPWHLTGRLVYRDAIGREGGHRTWAVVTCNDAGECDAELLIAVESLLDLLPADPSKGGSR